MIIPCWCASVSFQISYLAVLGIVFFQAKIAKLWIVENKWLDKIWQLVAVSIAAQIMTLPLTLFYFNQFPTWFWLSSLILVPLSGFELGAGLLLFLADALWQTGAVWVGKALWAMLWIGNQTVYLIQALPAAVIDGIWIGPVGAILLYLVIICGMLAIGSQKFKWMLSALGLLLLVSISSAFTSWGWHSNRRMTVYNIYKHSALDFFDGKKAWCLTSQNIEEKAVKFAVEGHRLAMGTPEITELLLSDSTAVQSENFFYEKGLVQFFDKRMAIVERPLEPVPHKIKVDYLLLRNSPKVEMDELMEIFEWQVVIFDASNKKWRLEKWKKSCQELGLEFYDINESGAWVLDL
jgi:competence protein ComEC